jgi:hypothetical protein
VAFGRPFEALDDSRLAQNSIVAFSEGDRNLWSALFVGNLILKQIENHFHRGELYFMSWN